MIYENFLQKIDNMTETDIFDFLIENMLIYDRIRCIYCQQMMKLNSFNKSELGYNWRCLNGNCSFNLTTLSALHCSFFHNSSISVKKNLKIIYYLCKKIKLSDISEFVGVSRNTIGKIKKNITDIINNYFLKTPIRLGGNNKCVQIDETKLNHNVKAHRGRSTVIPTWAITMVDTSVTPAKGFAQVVPDRSSSTLIPIIKNIVRSGTTIYTDEWKAYDPLANDTSYDHKKITHKYNFVDPLTGVHTQNVESFNNKIKMDIKNQKGVRTNDRPRFLTFFLFIDTYKDYSLQKILEILKIY